MNGNAAPLQYVASTQINFEVPIDVQGTSATIQVAEQIGGQTLQSGVVTIPLAASAPGLYTKDWNGVTLGNFVTGSGTLVTPVSPVTPEDSVEFFGTGFGKGPFNLVLTNPAGLSITFGTVTLPTFIFAGALDNFNGPDGMDQVSVSVPAGLVAGNVPVFVTINGQSSPAVLLPWAPTKQPTITSLVNAASGGAATESGSWATIYGTFLSATTRSWSASDFSGNLLPTTIDGVRVLVNGKNAAISYVSPGQLNIQVPDTLNGAAQVVVTNSMGSANGNVTIQTSAPGFFTFSGKYVAALHADWTDCAPVGYFGPGVSSRPAQPGEVMVLYGTGFGPTAPSTPAGQTMPAPEPLADLNQLQVFVGGLAASVQYAGIVSPGLYQINIVVPEVANGDQPLTATFAGTGSQAGVSIPIQRP